MLIRAPLLHMLAALWVASSLTVPVRAQPASGASERAQTLLREGRQALQTGDRFTALRLFGQARLLQPDDWDIRRAVADVLVDLGGNAGAASVLHPNVDLGLRSRVAGTHLRWAELVGPPEPARRFEDGDAAIVELEGALAEAQKAPLPDAPLVLRLQRDLVVGLHLRERWTDALAMAQTARAGGSPLPGYVRRAEAGALLSLRRPAEARQAYEDVLRVDPADRAARIGRFWSELEDEDFTAAFATVDALAADGSATRPFGQERSPHPDHDWLEAQLLAVQARRFGDMHAEAWGRLAPLVQRAPSSAALRSEQAELAAARGWPRLAHQEALIAYSLMLEDMDLELALAESELRRRQWAAAQARADRLALRDPTNRRLQRLQRDLDVWHMAELQLSVAPRKERGESAVAPGDGLGARARVYTGPLAERWRLLADANRESNQPRDEKLVRNRYGVGAEGRWPDMTAELIAWGNTGLMNHPGATASVQWQPDDHWSLHGQLEAFSPETPLLAIKAGIRADRVALSAVHAWNESRVASVGLQALDFTDGNRRLAVTLDHSSMVLQTPTTQVVLRPSLYASSNTRTDAPYFNPRRDGSLSLAVDVQNRLWRHYDRSWTQRLVLAAGPYWQTGFATHVTGSVTYEQAWRIDPLTEWTWGASLSRRYYDGDREDALVLFARLVQRF